MEPVRPTLWSLDELLALTGGRAVGGQPPWRATGISYRANRVKRGDLFVATETDAVDRHPAVGPALEAGAAGALVSRVPDRLPEGASLVVVDDTLKALERLATVARTRATARIAAITGSVGKTFTKDAIAGGLKDQGPTTATEKNDNDTLGVLISLARTGGDVQYGVYELSMLGPNSVRRKSKRVRPHVGLITRVGSAHLGYHDSVESIADAKAGLFAGLEERGIAVLNREDRFFARLETKARDLGAERIVTFGIDADSDVRLMRSTPDPEGGFRVVARVLDTEIDYLLGTAGGHHVVNSLGALATVAALGADPVAAAASFRALRETPGRGNRYRLARADGHVYVLDFSRSAEPTSVRAALDCLSRVGLGPGGRRIAVLGDMLALGERSAEIHEALAADALNARVDSVYAAGGAMRHLYDALPAERRGAHAATADDVAPIVLGDVRSGDAVLVQGGRLTRMNRVVRALVGEAYESW